MRKGRSARLPRAFLKGRKILDDIDGNEYYENDPFMTKQRGLNVHRKNHDSLLDTEREEQIRR